MARNLPVEEHSNYSTIDGMTVYVDFVNSAREFKWRLRWEHELSDWSSHYQGILVHEFSNGRKFFVLTAYWEGNGLPIEKPLEARLGIAR